jgi:hypothetical protein
LLPHSRPRLFPLALVAVAALCAASCAVPLGPGYTVEKQEITVHFVPAPEPSIHVEATFRLRNTGNQPLSSLELRLPGRRRFHLTELQTAWDGTPLEQKHALENSRNTLLALPSPWLMSASHALQVSLEISPPAGDETGLSFSSDAFFLPSAGWAPQLLPPRGLFPTGGGPPKKWNLVVEAPRDFLVHASGKSPKRTRRAGEITWRAEQQPRDPYPFVIAGRYLETQLGGSKQRVLLWTRTQKESDALRSSAEAMVRVIQAYDESFGSLEKQTLPLRIVECPVVKGCFASTASSYAELFGDEPQSVSAEMAALDTVMVDVSAGPPKIAASATPALAATWLGYARNPGFFEQQRPLSAFPAFAAAVGREAVEGASFRTATIRRALRVIPASAPARTSEDAAVLRAKSLLFFYALQDRYGAGTLRTAVRHMLSARRGRSFEIQDLISALEQETHQNVAEFVRLWIKHPGVPPEFRSRYEDGSTVAATTSKETVP